MVSLGLDLFARELEQLGVPVAHVDWRPPAHADPALLRALERLEGRRDLIDRANAEAFDRLVNGVPVLVDCRPAWEALELPPRTVLHAGPPVEWARMCEPMRAAVLGAVRYEGWAANDDAATTLIERGDVRLEPCHHWRAVGPMTGIVTASMPVFVVENRAQGNRAHATINEGLGKVLRFGANDESVIARLRWLAGEAGPLLGAALRASGGLELRPLMAQALRMGDEMHQRNVAASSLLGRALMPHVARAAGKHGAVARLAEFLAGNDQFFLNVAMAAGKTLGDAAGGVAHSTLVTTMARNGTDFAIRVSGLGERWFAAPVLMPAGLYFPGFWPPTPTPTWETAPSWRRSVSAGAPWPPLRRWPASSAPAASPRPWGRPGRSLRSVAASTPTSASPRWTSVGPPSESTCGWSWRPASRPLINTGIAGRKAGTGQIGAGVVRAPLACFERALLAQAGG